MQDLEISLRDQIDKAFQKATAEFNSGNIDKSVQIGEEAGAACRSQSLAGMSVKAMRMHLLCSTGMLVVM